MTSFPKLSLNSSRGNIEGVFQALAWSCFHEVNPKIGLEKLHDIKSWAQNTLDETSFLLLFGSFEKHSVSFGGFGIIEFSMDERYGIPSAHSVNLCQDALKFYSTVTLDDLLAQMHKIQATLMAIKAKSSGMTDRPIQHMLPTETSEQYRCGSLYHVVICVWTRMCHIWGRNKDYGEFGELFAPQALTCFSLDGQFKVPYLWLDVDTTDEKNFVYSIKSHTFDTSVKRRFKIRIKHPNKQTDWVIFGLDIGQQLLVDEKETHTPDVLIVVYSRKDDVSDPFKVVQGQYHDNNYFLMVTERGAYRSFSMNKGNTLSAYPVLFHPMLEDALGVTPRKMDPQKSPKKCSMCRVIGKPLSVYDLGTFCSNSCLIAYTQRKGIKNVKIEF